MRTLGMIGRLYWFALRQGWLVLLVGAALPWLAMVLQQQHVKVINTMPLPIALVLITLGLMVWAATQGAGARPRRGYAGVHFPIAASWPAEVAFFTVLLVSLGIGASAGYAVSRIFPDDTLFFIFGQLVLYFAVLGMLCYACATGLSAPAGMVAGIIWLICSGELFTIVANASKVANHQLPDFYYNPLPLDIIRAAVPLLGVVLAAVVLLPPRLPLTLRRVFAGVLLALGFFGIYGVDTLDNYLSDLHTPWYQQERYGWQYISSDGSLQMIVHVNRFHTHPRLPLECVDYRANRTWKYALATPAAPVGFLGRDSALLLAQAPGSRQVTVLRWTFAAKTMTPLATFDAPRDAVKDLDQVFVSRQRYTAVSPDSRYAAILLKSATNGMFMYDLWRLDIVHGTVRLLRPAVVSAFNTNLGWRDGAVVVASYEKAWQFDLATGRMTPFHLPSMRRARP
jgi:hypothetical protein